MSFAEFIAEGLFFARFWFLHIVRMMYWIWIPGFLLAGILAVRYQHATLERLRGCRTAGWPGIRFGVLAAFTGTGCRRHAVARTINLLQSGVAPSAALAYWVASHSAVMYLLVLLELALGIEFAVSLLLAGVLTATLVGVVGGRVLRVPSPNGGLAAPQRNWHDVETPRTWTETLFARSGWAAAFRYFVREVGAVALPLAWGMLVGGFLLAAGLLSWWPTPDESGGLGAHLVTGFVAPFAAIAAGVTAVGAVPAVASLWKTHTVAFAGLLAFVLGTLFHPLSWQTWTQAVGVRQTLRLWGLTFASIVIVAFGLTGAYALVGFHPSREPVFEEIARKILMWLPFTMDKMGP